MAKAKSAAHWLMLPAIGLLIVNLFVGVKLHGQASAEEEREDAYRNMELFAQILGYVRKEYVDAEKVHYQDLYYSALRGMLASLDPHSQFLDPRSYEGMQEDTSGAFGGLGIQIGMRDSVLTVIAPMEDTPAYQEGILPGDRIIEVEGQGTENMTLNEAVEKLRGEPGTKVTITILRVGERSREIKKVTMTRAIINVTSVKWDKDLHPGGIGYIRITQFNTPTEGEFDEALKDLQAKGMEALVLDLRNNPGGLLTSACRVTSEFIPEGKLIVSTQGRSQETRKYNSSRGEKQPPYPMVVLVNGYSASGSEIVAGALQDHRRAVLIGERTYGKGSVQSVLPIPNGAGAAVRLTTAKYYTPSERLIHGVGIEPDILVPISDDMERALFLQRSRPENGYDQPTKPVPDVQLERAFDLLRGLKIFAERQGVEYAWH